MPRTAEAGGTLTGILREQIPVEPYVYVRLETVDGDIWAAVNEAPLTIGASVTVYNAFAMEQFASETLNRTFELIYFGALEPLRGMEGGATMNGGAAGAAGASEAFPGASGTPLAEVAKVGPVKRASGANARTIGEVWGEKVHLIGATVSIRGVVVKYNPGVMGKNWIHLQDGSGDAANGTHDLVVTSLDAAAVGDTVTVTGTVQTNRDVGAGYVFALLVEDAKIVAR